MCYGIDSNIFILNFILYIVKIMKSGIYTITNLVNGKIYVGLSKNLEARKHHHFNELKHDRHDNEHLTYAYKKYGKENFSFEVLEEYPIEYLIAMEHYWCTILNTNNRNYGYNIKLTHPEKENVCSNETRIKLSLANKGKKRSEEVKKAISERHKNNPMTEEHKNKLVEARRKVGISEEGRNRINLGIKNRIKKPMSEEHKQKLRIANLGKKILFRKKRDFCTHKGKSVICYDLQGNFIKEYRIVYDVEKDGFNADFVIAVCKGRKLKYKNLLWKYKMDGIIMENQ